MLEAILFLRCGVVLSSAPREKLESPPGGRRTLNRESEKEKMIRILVDKNIFTWLSLSSFQAK